MKKGVNFILVIGLILFLSFSLVSASVLGDILGKIFRNNKSNLSPDDGLIAYYPFDDETAGDKSGNNYNGVLRNGVKFDEGKIGKGAQFDGTDDFIRVDGVKMNSGDFSISFWIKPGFDSKSAPSRGEILWLGDSNSANNPNYYALLHHESGLSAFLVDTDNGNYWANKQVEFLSNNPNWIHFVGVFDSSGGAIYFYVNGVEVDKKDVSDNDIDGKGILWIGKVYSSYFKGTIDEVKIYNKKLSMTEINEIYTPSVDKPLYDCIVKDNAGNIIFRANNDEFLFDVGKGYSDSHILCYRSSWLESGPTHDYPFIDLSNVINVCTNQGEWYTDREEGLWKRGDYSSASCGQTIDGCEVRYNGIILYKAKNNELMQVLKADSGYTENKILCFDNVWWEAVPLNPNWREFIKNENVVQSCTQVGDWHINGDSDIWNKGSLPSSCLSHPPIIPVFSCNELDLNCDADHKVDKSDLEILNKISYFSNRENSLSSLLLNGESIDSNFNSVLSDCNNLKNFISKNVDSNIEYFSLDYQSDIKEKLKSCYCLNYDYKCDKEVNSEDIVFFYSYFQVPITQEEVNNVRSTDLSNNCPESPMANYLQRIIDSGRSSISFAGLRDSINQISSCLEGNYCSSNEDCITSNQVCLENRCVKLEDVNTLDCPNVNFNCNLKSDRDDLNPINNVFLRMSEDPSLNLDNSLIDVYSDQCLVLGNYLQKVRIGEIQNDNPDPSLTQDIITKVRDKISLCSPCSEDLECPQDYICSNEKCVPALTSNVDDYVVTENIDLSRSQLRSETSSNEYTLSDNNLNGAFIIGGDDIIFDCNGATLVGNLQYEDSASDFYKPKGIGIYIDGRKNVVVKNCDISGLTYGIYIKNSKNVIIENNNIHDNMRDLRGGFLGPRIVPLRINPGSMHYYNQYGGGIYIEDSLEIEILNNKLMRSQSGIMMIGVNSSKIYDNDASFNTGWGIYMSQSNFNEISRNKMDYVDKICPGHEASREQLPICQSKGNTIPLGGLFDFTNAQGCGCDTAGMFVFKDSSNNQITYNSFKYGGDGFFLTGSGGGGDTPSYDLPNYNYIAYNDGSYSPANAFESTHGVGNYYYKNNASNSGHGFWVGLSINQTLIQNEIIGNSIVGIDGPGISQIIRGNIIENNSYRGIALWTDQTGMSDNREWVKARSHVIINNKIIHNGLTPGGSGAGIEIINTSGSNISYNYLFENGVGIIVNSNWQVDYDYNITFNEIIDSRSSSSGIKFISAMNHGVINAESNWWGTVDRNSISASIIRRGIGEVDFEPFLERSLDLQNVCQPLLENGAHEDKIDIIVVGDRFNDVNDLRKNYAPICTGVKEPTGGDSKGILGYYPFNENKDKFNVYFLREVNDFHFSYDCSYLSRVKQYVLTKCPYIDQIVVIADGNFNGGFSCGKDSLGRGEFVVGKSRVDEGGGVCAHEFGHAFGMLCDEYNSGQTSQVTPSCPNCDSDTSCSKWSGIEGTGCYPICYNTNWYRSTQTSVMGEWANNNEVYGRVSEDSLIKSLSGYN